MPTSLFENPRSYSPKDSVPDLSNLIVIWDAINLFLPTPFSLGCCLVFLGMNPVLKWCRPMSVLGIGVVLFITCSLLHSLPRYSLSWMLDRPCPMSGYNRCCVWVHGVLCRIWCRPSGGCMLISLLLWGLLSTCMTIYQIEGSHDELIDGHDQMRVLFIVYLKHDIGQDWFLVFSGGFQWFISPELPL